MGSLTQDRYLWFKSSNNVCTKCCHAVLNHGATGNLTLCQKFKKYLWMYMMCKIPRPVNLLNQSYYDLLWRFKMEYRCLECGRVSFEESITCEMCMDHQYCSFHCLHAHSKKHRPVCLYLRIKKKGLYQCCHPSPDAFYEILYQSKVLDDSGYIDNASTHHCSLKKLENMFKSRNSRKGVIPMKSKAQDMQDRFESWDCETEVHKEYYTEEDEKRNNDWKIRMVELTTHGTFGSYLLPDTGNTFGEGWWKCSTYRQSRLVKNGLRILGNEFQDTFKSKTKLKYADFYGSDSDEDQEDKEEANVCHRISCSFDLAHGSNMAPESSRISESSISTVDGTNPDPKCVLDVSTGKQENMSYCDIQEPCPASESDVNSGTSDSFSQTSDLNPCNSIVSLTTTNSTDEEKPQRARNTTVNNDFCCFCFQLSGSIKTCSRCGCAKYCSKKCQINHFTQHKISCSRMRNYLMAKSKIPPFVIDMLQMKYGTSVIASDWQDVYEFWPFAYYHQHVLAKIVMAVPLLPSCCLVTIENCTGDRVELFLKYSSPISMFHVPNFGEPITLPECVAPGNFVLMTDVKWTSLTIVQDGLICSDDQCFFILKRCLVNSTKNIKEK